MDNQFLMFLKETKETKETKEMKEMGENTAIKTETLLSKEQKSKFEWVISGYIREENANSKIFIYDNITDLIFIYSKMYGSPHVDPVNYISTKDIENGEQYRLSGNQLFKQKKYSDALIKYRTALKYNPNDYKVHCNISFCHLKLNNLSFANRSALWAIACSPNKIKCWYRYGSVAYKLGDVKTAYLAFRTATNICNIMNVKNVSLQKQLNLVKQRMTDKDHEYIQCIDTGNFYGAYVVFVHLNMYALLEMGYNDDEEVINAYYQDFWPFCVDLYTFMKHSESIKLIKNPSSIKYIKADPNPNMIWIVSYASNGEIRHNKRVFMIQIAQDTTNIVDIFHEVFGKPTCSQVVAAILDTMLCGFREKIDGDQWYLGFASKPQAIYLAHRLKDISNEVTRSMTEYGIPCILENEESAKLTAAMHGTNVNGFNFYQNVERIQEIKTKMNLKYPN